MKLILNKDNWLSGLQWFFFIFCNTVIIPATLQAVFQLSTVQTINIVQYSFVATSLACLAQAFCGHKRAIMEGPTGLWWSVILTLTLSESTQGTPLSVIGGSLAVGIFMSGLMTLFIGLSGLGYRLATLFRPAVMVVFTFLLGSQLITIFTKGMLGLPFGIPTGVIKINFSAFFLSLGIVIFIVIMIIKIPPRISKYALLMGTLLGWLIFVKVFNQPHQSIAISPLTLFPLGLPTDIKPGIVITALLTGLMNISNTFGSIRGTDIFYGNLPAQPAVYKRSFMTTGIVIMLISPLGVVPFSPFVSSIGLLSQTQDASRRSFVLGSFMFLLVGLLTPLTLFFYHIPLTVISAVMLVSYLPLFYSSVQFLTQVKINARNFYRLAIPIFTGIFLMGVPTQYLQDIPLIIRPLLSNGLLVGVLLAIILEKCVVWDRIK